MARMKELGMWVDRGQQELSRIQQDLEAAGLSPEKRQQFSAELKSKQATLKRHSDALAKQPSIMASERWM